MTAETRPVANSETPASGALPSASRRRLFQGVAGATGVLLSMQAKTALGTGICDSPSGRLSGNQSPRPGLGVTCKPGDHPNTWLARSSSWPTGCAKAVFKSSTTDASLGNMKIAATRPNGYRNIAAVDLDNEGILMSSLVTGAPAVGLWRAMACESCVISGRDRVLLSYLCAAWVNSQAYTGTSGRFPITELEVKLMATAAINGQLYCPSSLSCTTASWTPAQVLSYLQSLMGSSGMNSAYVKNGTNNLTV